jgi:hypothetical protein
MKNRRSHGYSVRCSTRTRISCSDLELMRLLYLTTQHLKSYGIDGIDEIQLRFEHLQPKALRYCGARETGQVSLVLTGFR